MMVTRIRILLTIIVIAEISLLSNDLNGQGIMLEERLVHCQTNF